MVRARGLAFLQRFVALTRMLDFLNRAELGQLLQASRAVAQYSAEDFEEFTGSEIRHQEVARFVLEQRRAPGCSHYTCRARPGGRDGGSKHQRLDQS